jgi:hypothetical protein
MGLFAAVMAVVDRFLPDSRRQIAQPIVLSFVFQAALNLGQHSIHIARE